MAFLVHVLNRILDIYIFIVCVNVILSWIVFSIKSDIIRHIYSFTGQLVDPMLQPIRSLVQPLSGNIGIDFSPMLLLVFLYFLKQLLIM